MKKISLFLVVLFLLNTCTVAFGEDGEDYKVYLNENYEDNVTNSAPTKGQLTGSGNIVRVSEQGGTKVLLIRNKNMSAITYDIIPNGRYLFIETRLCLFDNHSQKSVIQVVAGGNNDLVIFDVTGRILDVNKKELGRYEIGKWYKVAVRLNLNTNKYDAYVNDKLVKRRISGGGTFKNIPKLSYTSKKSEEETKTMIDYFRAYSGFEKQDESIFPIPKWNSKTQKITTDEVEDIITKPELLKFENFEGIPEGGIADGILKISEPIGVVFDKKTKNKYLLQNRTENTSAMRIDVDINKTVTALTVQADFIATKKSAVTALFMLRDMYANFFTTMTADSMGNIKLLNGTVLPNVSILNKWVNIAICVDFDEKLYDVYVNGELAASDLSFQDLGITGNLNLVRFEIKAGGEDTLGMDNLKIYTGRQLVENIEAEALAAAEARAAESNFGKGVLKDVEALAPRLGEFEPVPEYNSDNPSGYLGDYAAEKNIFSQAICFIADNSNACIFGEKYKMDKPIILDGGSAFVSARDLAAVLGLDLSWDEETQTIRLGEMEFNEGKTAFTADGTEIPLQSPIKVLDGVSYLPLKEIISDAMGKYYFSSSKGAYVISDENMMFNDKTYLDVIVRMMNYTVFDRPNAKKLREVFSGRWKNKEHPRLLATTDELSAIKARVEADAQLKSWSDNVIDMANNLVSAALPKAYYNPPDLAMKGFTGHGAILNLFWAYYMTGDLKYAETAEAHAVAMCNFTDWNAKNQFLETSAILQAEGLAYDLFYDVLSPEAKELIAEKIVEYGLKPAMEYYFNISTNKNTWPVRTNNNWNIVCNAGIVVGALAIMDDRDTDFCSDALEKAIKSAELMMGAYAPEGAWAEGPSYWSYAVENLVMALSSLDSVLGMDYGFMDFPGVRKTGYFPIYLSGNTGVFAYHDSDRGYIVNSSAMSWFAYKNNDRDLAKLRKNILLKNNFKGNVLDVLWSKLDDLPEEVDLPTDRYYTLSEVATMRSDWGANSTFVAMHAGANTTSHGQLDIGDFQYEASGSLFACEMGRDSYFLADVYVRRAEGQNVYVLNPDITGGQEAAASAVIKPVVNKPKGSIYTIDMTQAYEKDVDKATRGFMLSGNRKIFTVQDEITSNSKSEKDCYWFWHTEGDIQIDNDNKIATITQKGKIVDIHFASNVSFDLSAGKSLPLDTSPVNDEQLNNLTKLVNKITAKFSFGKGEAVTFRAIAVPRGITYNKTPLTAIETWEIPDGEGLMLKDL